MRCALIGEKLSHSYSALIHNKFGNYSYEAVEVPPGGLEKFCIQPYGPPGAGVCAPAPGGGLVIGCRRRRGGAPAPVLRGSCQLRLTPCR